MTSEYRTEPAPEESRAFRAEPGSLYVVATPIGNLRDVTLRALDILRTVDVIRAEDTRVSATLLARYGIATRPRALHAHNEARESDAVVRDLAAGRSVALMTDAGTPAVSDPGAGLVAAARAAGHRVVPIPGASSALAAFSVAGDAASTGFAFAGFLPARGAERTRAVAAIARAPMSQVVFEAPHRIESLASALAAACPERTTTVCRELTKQFETVATMPARELVGWLAADANRARGEFVLVLHASPARAGDDESAHDALLVPLLAALPLKHAVAVAAEVSGAPRNALYARALALRGARDEG